ncbi:MAG: hypothetical protein U1F53_24460 [Burkholderiaceae bacterium]
MLKIRFVGAMLSVIAVVTTLLGCSAYQGNMKAKAEIWAKDFGCDKISDFKETRFVSGSAQNINGETFRNAITAGFGEYSFDCYFSGAGWRHITFAGYLMNNPETDHDFGFFGDETIAQGRAQQAGFAPDRRPTQDSPKPAAPVNNATAPASPPSGLPAGLSYSRTAANSASAPAPSKFARCAGSLELEQCEAAESALLAETEEARRERVARLEAERVENMRQVNQAAASSN